MEVTTSYAICTTPHSGGQLLASALEATGVVGRPRQWFDDEVESHLFKKWPLSIPEAGSYAAYLSKITELGCTPNGIFGVHINRRQLDSLPSKLATISQYREASQSNALTVAFPGLKHIWLTRRDKNRQAVGFFRDQQATATTSGNATRPALSDAAGPHDLLFDPEAIKRIKASLLSSDLEWQRYFSGPNIKPLVVFYEDLEADFHKTISRILYFIGIPAGTRVGVPNAVDVPRSDAGLEEWVEKFAKFEQATARAASTSEKSQNVVSTHWRRWMAERKLLGATDDVIVRTLEQNGVSGEAARAELQRMCADPCFQGSEWVVDRLAKMQCVLNVQDAMSRLDPRALVIERRSNVSRVEFVEKYYAANRPVVLTDALAGCKALGLWTPEYLKSVIGEEEVEFMGERHADANYELNAHQHRRKGKFADYVDMVCSGGETNDYYLVGNNRLLDRPGAKRLFEDLAFPSEYLDPAVMNRNVYLWVGPAGTVTQLHHDNKNVLLAQLRGRKRIKLIPANQIGLVYNQSGVFSAVDCDDPDLGRWPDFGRATVLEATLAPGESLFLPAGWWHHVRALDVSMTLSFTNFLFPNEFVWRHPTGRQ
jgi:LPS sulfotransferase NodH